ncbi:MAG: hypothetical protein HQL30_08495 [Candidatus Omnitrophica bacterium]|nr:hypothetical protein [Candidatus Omnitrophota bacterium]
MPRDLFIMPRSILRRTITVLFMFFLSDSSVHALNVYYVGGGGAKKAAGAPAEKRKFTFEDRARDLFDLKAYGEQTDERSGWITGNVSEEVNFNAVDGNGAKSFLRRGVYQNTEVNTTVFERLWEDYELESNTFVRKTDDRRIESRKDVRLKQFDVSLANEKNYYGFGDQYGDLTPYTLSNSFQGFDVIMQPSDSLSLQAVSGRSQSPDQPLQAYLRRVNGGKLDYLIPFDEKGESELRTGFQGITSRDDSSTIDRVDGAMAINNTVVSVDGALKIMKDLKLSYELARSEYVEDEKSRFIRDPAYGTAFNIKPDLRMGPFYAKYLYYKADPDFYTDAGSVMADKQQHEWMTSYNFGKMATLSLTENYYWDHLKGSEFVTKRTYYDEQYVNLSLYPIEDNKRVRVSGYFNNRAANADDPGNTGEVTNRTTGTSLTHSLANGMNYNMKYEYRESVNDYDPVRSDFYNRLGFGVGDDIELFSKRFQWKTDLTSDIRNPRNEDDEDIKAGIAVTGQYFFSAAGKFKFGHNVQAADNARPRSDYVINRSYLELDFLIEKKRNAHFVARVENNNYIHDVSNNEYDESRIITKVISNF